MSDRRLLSRRQILAAGPVAFGASAWAETPRQKFALVIGNGDYDLDGRANSSTDAVRRSQERGYVGDLANAWFDAVRVGEALRGAGFSVETVNNANRGMMFGAIMNFQARVAAAGPSTAAVLYYAGHGIQLAGRNYLVGVGAQLIAADMPADTAEQREHVGNRIGVPLQQLLMTRPPRAPGYSLVLIDACRDNPWEDMIRAATEAGGRRYVGERGFGAMSVNPRTVVCFSAQPGELAVDGIAAASSPFANALVNRLRRPGTPIDDLLQGVSGEVAAFTGAKQTPWVRGRLGDGTSL